MPLSTRREFLKRTAAGAAVLAFRPSRAIARGLEPLSFGLCADVHQDVMHDAPERLAAFVSDMNRRRVAFIAQLGDFCIPKKENQGFLDVFHSFDGPHYHVLGNHDTDSENLTKNGYTQEQTKAFWGMERDYYSFVHGGYRFVVVDGNDRPENAGTSYPRLIGEPQLLWLERELRTTEEPVVLLSHQSPENAEGLENGDAVRAILERANESAGWRRVLAWFSGHHHLNDLVRVNGIPYVQVNSMSYFWVGEECRNFSYSEAVHSAHPMMEFTAPYRDPLWTTVTLDPEAGEIRVEGRESAWVGRSPEELGYEAPLARRKGMSPRIDDRKIEVERG